MQSRERGNKTPWGWIGFFVVVLLLALLSTFAVLRGGWQIAQRQAPDAGLLRVILSGQAHYLDERDAAKLSPRIEAVIGNRREQVIRGMEVRIDQRVEQAFGLVLERVPLFADWYYSLQGEYMRYAHALGGDMSAYLQRRMDEEVFQVAGLEQALDTMTTDWNGETGRELHTALRAVGADLSVFLDEHTRPAPPRNGQEGTQAAEPEVRIGTVDLDPILGQSLTVGDKDMSRQAASALAAAGFGAAVAKGLGAVVVKKTIASIAATKSFQTAAALLAKLAAKMALKGGGTAGAAATGLVVCSPGGPAALLCGMAAGLIAWVTVDKVFIELDEALNRQQFEADIRHAIIQQQEQLQTELKIAYRGLLEAQFAQLQGRLIDQLPSPPTDFVPADAVEAMDDESGQAHQVLP